MKSDFYVLKRDAISMNELNVDVDCIYIDPPFGLQKEHFMKESDGSNKSFLDEWESQN